MRYLMLTALLAAGCQPEYHRAFDDTHCEPDDVSILNYGDAGVARLEATIGVERRLPTALQQPVEVRWTARDRRAVELEVQVQVVDVGSVAALPPSQLADNIYWKLRDHAHGDTTYVYPPSNIGNFGSTMPTWSLPARGARARLSARDLIVQVAHNVAVAPNEVTPLLRVSIEPVDGALVPVWPSSAFFGVFPVPFPMGAVEWRVAGVAPAQDLLVQDITGATIDTIPASAVADWTLIDPNAVTVQLAAGPFPAAVAAFR